MCIWFFILFTNMPRYYRAHRYAGRYRRRSTVLSTRNIYGRRSAYSQASQIAALRRRVSKVYRACKPERKVLDATLTELNFSSRAGGDVYYSLAAFDVDRGANDNQRVGDKIYRKDTYALSLEYFNTSTTGYHDSESSGCQVRIICGCYKGPVARSSVPLAEDLVTNFSTTGAGYTASAVSPLVNGITERYNIYSDNLYTLTTDRNQKIIKVKTPWYNCRHEDNDTPIKSNHSFIVVIVAGLHFDSNFSEFVSGVCSRKTVFTDA